MLDLLAMYEGGTEGHNQVGRINIKPSYQLVVRCLYIPIIPYISFEHSFVLVVQHASPSRIELD
jgi:hypothetical protein